MLVNGNPLDDVTVLPDPARIKLVLKGGALASSSHRAPVCYHPATVRPGTIHHAEA